MRHAPRDRLRRAGRPQEGLLHGIPGFVHRSGHAAGEAVEAAMVCVEELAEPLGSVGPRAVVASDITMASPIISSQTRSLSIWLAGVHGKKGGRAGGGQQAGAGDARPRGSGRSPVQSRASNSSRAGQERLVQRRGLAQRQRARVDRGRRESAGAA